MRTLPSATAGHHVLLVAGPPSTGEIVYEGLASSRSHGLFVGLDKLPGRLLSPFISNE
jgi:hypothetical protein